MISAIKHSCLPIGLCLNPVMCKKKALFVTFETFYEDDFAKITSVICAILMLQFRQSLDADQKRYFWLSVIIKLFSLNTLHTQELLLAHLLKQCIVDAALFIGLMLILEPLLCPIHRFLKESHSFCVFLHWKHKYSKCTGTCTLELKHGRPFSVLNIKYPFKQDFPDFFHCQEFIYLAKKIKSICRLYFHRNAKILENVWRWRWMREWSGTAVRPPEIVVVSQLVIILLMILQPLINLFCLCPTFGLLCHFATLQILSGGSWPRRPSTSCTKQNAENKTPYPKVLTTGFSHFDNVQIPPLTTCERM